MSSCSGVFGTLFLVNQKTWSAGVGSSCMLLGFLDAKGSNYLLKECNPSVTGETVGYHVNP